MIASLYKEKKSLLAPRDSAVIKQTKDENSKLGSTSTESCRKHSPASALGTANKERGIPRSLRSIGPYSIPPSCNFFSVDEQRSLKLVVPKTQTFQQVKIPMIKMCEI